MRKIVILIIALVMISSSIFVGCESNKSNEEKILGKWLGTFSASTGNHQAILIFFSNGNISVNYNETITWGTYTITDKVLNMIIYGQSVAVKYSFSNNNQKLTLIYEVDGSSFAVLTKQ
jgi:hypothetical protein